MHEVHIFSDVSVLVCDYLPYGTLLVITIKSFRNQLYKNYLSIYVREYVSTDNRCLQRCNYSNLLQDVINSHIVVERHMDEVLCMYYTIEMLRMLETLHSVGIIHGDFKPDNMLVCYPR